MVGGGQRLQTGIIQHQGGFVGQHTAPATAQGRPQAAQGRFAVLQIHRRGLQQHIVAGLLAQVPGSG